MKAIVFAAGLGTRLGEFTREHPKALVEVGGVPMLERVLQKLSRAGIDEVVVNVHHFADQICDYLAGRDYGGMKLHISLERELLLETGGGILAAMRLTDFTREPLLIHNADILTDFPLQEMTARHRADGAEATLLTAERRTSRYLLFDPATRLMQGWTNVTTGEVRPAGLTPSPGMLRRAFGGVHVASPELLVKLQAYNDILREAGAEADSRGICRFSIMKFYIDSCDHVPVASYEPSQPYRWCDIGKPESLAEARRLFA